MPHFFFQFADTDQPSDIDGIELPDLTAARLVAMDVVAERLKGNGGRFWELGCWHLTVADGNREPLFMVSLSGKDAATD